MTQASEWERLGVEVLATHYYRKDDIHTARCGGCDWSSSVLGRHMPTLHAAHVMAEFRRAGLAAVLHSKRVPLTQTYSALMTGNFVLEESFSTPWREFSEIAMCPNGCDHAFHPFHLINVDTEDQP